MGVAVESISRFSLNMLSAVSPQGALRFSVQEGTVNATVFIGFCQRLLYDADSPVYLAVAWVRPYQYAVLE
ncbi:hypothetical protein GCM10010464_08500 [Pseudonocardia yunnanensis]|uniref:Uncharacterized protein n=1 Tax=Pseudonocardia yunnanensis TaxID=58107 RepID=A0ABW4ET53_9PSEU